jgi:indole-3-glycerol phosphate synthase
MILDAILTRTRTDVAARRARRPLRELEGAIAALPPARGFAAALARAPGGIGLIAELKRASPSAGTLRQEYDVPALASAYARGGAACLSVLTDTPFFQGDLAHLEAAAAPGLPRLQKDFVLDEYQVLEGRVAGADAVLLIAEALPRDRRQALAALALDVGLDVLCEAHVPALVREIATLAERSPEHILVGVNNRDLRTFAVTLETSLAALRELPAGLRIVSESGIRTAADVVRLRDAGACGILVGEGLLRAEDVEAAARALLAELE